MRRSALRDNTEARGTDVVLWSNKPSGDDSVSPVNEEAGIDLS